MPCKKPIYLRHLATKDNPQGIEVDCGQCTACRMKKAHQWALRCINELQYWKDSSFVTLTYSDEFLPSSYSVYKPVLQLFFKRLRQCLKNNTWRILYEKLHKGESDPFAKKTQLKFTENIGIKYFACGEYGEKYKRPHYHAIIFGLPAELHEVNKDGHVLSGPLFESWTFGLIHLGSVSYDSIRYTTDYVYKKYNGKVAKKVYGDLGLNVPFQLQSKGIGERWFIDNREQLRKDFFMYNRGKKVGMPRYYKDKLYNSRFEHDVFKKVYMNKRQEYTDSESSDFLKRGLDQSEFSEYAKKRAYQSEANLKARINMRNLHKEL